MAIAHHCRRPFLVVPEVVEIDPRPAGHKVGRATPERP